MIALLAGVVLVGLGALVGRLRPYWVAKYHGEGADLRGAVLVFAPLSDADLFRARLNEASLRTANLREASLDEAQLQRADLRDADLSDAALGGANLAGADLRGADLGDAELLLIATGDGREITGTDANFHGARYDRRTRWPAGFDPLKHGAILER
jgi:uncharacterized protein YjbI with pentapeptide repeats